MKVAKKVIGVAGWSGSGKTRLVVALVKEFAKRDLRVSTMKHAHRDFDIDREGKDSYAHRAAGAHEVLIASEKRWALMHECNAQEKDDARWLSPALLLKHLAPVDVLLVEGFKSAPLDKLEVRRSSVQKKTPLLAASDSRVRALVSDEPLLPPACSPPARRHALPVFSADEPSRIADFVLDSDWFRSP